LGRNGYVGRVTHLAQQREHPAWVLLALARRHRAKIGHHPRAFHGSVSVAALRDERPETHRGHRGKPLSTAASSATLISDGERMFPKSKSHARVLEKSNLLRDVIARSGKRARALASISCVRETLPATKALSPATSLASFTAAKLISSFAPHNRRG